MPEGSGRLLGNGVAVEEVENRIVNTHQKAVNLFRVNQRARPSIFMGYGPMAKGPILF